MLACSAVVSVVIVVAAGNHVAAVIESISDVAEKRVADISVAYVY